MRYTNGVPRVIDDLHIEPAHNHPNGYEEKGVVVLLEHIRALSAFVAQLHARLKLIETRMPDDAR